MRIFRVCPTIFEWQHIWRKRIIFKKQKFSIRVKDFVCFFLFQAGIHYKKASSSIEVLIGFTNSRNSHRRCSSVHSLFLNKAAEHLLTTASVIPSLQYTLFITHSIFYFSLEYLWLHGLSVWKLPSNCLLNPLSVSCFLMICAAWLINFQMVLFYMRLSSVYLVSIQQLRKLIVEM